MRSTHCGTLISVAQDGHMAGHIRRTAMAVGTYLSLKGHGKRILPRLSATWSAARQLSSKHIRRTYTLGTLLTNRNGVGARRLPLGASRITTIPSTATRLDLDTTAVAHLEAVGRRSLGRRALGSLLLLGGRLAGRDGRLALLVGPALPLAANTLIPLGNLALALGALAAAAGGEFDVDLAAVQERVVQFQARLQLGRGGELQEGDAARLGGLAGLGALGQETDGGDAA